MKDTQGTIAFQFVGVDSQDASQNQEMKSALASLDNYLTYYFVSYEKSSTDGQKTEVISAVDCLGKYAEEDIQTKKLVDQF